MPRYFGTFHPKPGRAGTSGTRRSSRHQLGPALARLVELRCWAIRRCSHAKPEGSEVVGIGRARSATDFVHSLIRDPAHAAEVDLAKPPVRLQPDLPPRAELVPRSCPTHEQLSGHLDARIEPIGRPLRHRRSVVQDAAKALDQLGAAVDNRRLESTQVDLGTLTSIDERRPDLAAWLAASNRHA